MQLQQLAVPATSKQLSVALAGRRPQAFRQTRSDERSEADLREPGSECSDRRRQRERKQHLAAGLHVVPSGTLRCPTAAKNDRRHVAPL